MVSGSTEMVKNRADKKNGTSEYPVFFKVKITFLIAESFRGIDPAAAFDSPVQ